MVVIAIVLFKMTNGPPELAPPANVPKVIPRYIYQGMSAEKQKEMRDQGYTIADSGGQQGQQGQGQQGQAGRPSG